MDGCSAAVCEVDLALRKPLFWLAAVLPFRAPLFSFAAKPLSML